MQSAHATETKYIIFKLSDDNTQIEVEKESDSTSYDDFLNDLPPNSPRYGVYDFEYEKDGGKRNKICFYAWSPDEAKIKEKMLYASSKDALRRSLVGIANEIQGTDSSEVAYDEGVFCSRSGSGSIVLKYLRPQSSTRSRAEPRRQTFAHPAGVSQILLLRILLPSRAAVRTGGRPRLWRVRPPAVPAPTVPTLLCSAPRPLPLKKNCDTTHLPCPSKECAERKKGNDSADSAVAAKRVRSKFRRRRIVQPTRALLALLVAPTRSL